MLALRQDAGAVCMLCCLKIETIFKKPCPITPRERFMKNGNFVNASWKHVAIVKMVIEFDRILRSNWRYSAAADTDTRIALYDHHHFLKGHVMHNCIMPFASCEEIWNNDCARKSA